MHAENKPFDLEELNLVRIMESLPDAILVVNTDSQVMYVNRKFCEEFGYHADEARNLRMRSLTALSVALRIISPSRSAQRFWLRGLRRF